MPISICKTKDQVKKWCEEIVKKEGSFFVYYTVEENELILEPAKSTRPLRYLYIKLMPTEQDKEPAKTLATELGKLYSLPIIEVSRFSWDVEKSPAVRMPVE